MNTDLDTTSDLDTAVAPALPARPTAPDTVPTDVLVDLVHGALMSGRARWQIDAAIAAHAEKTGLVAPTAAEIDSAYALVVEHWMTDANEPADITYAYHIAQRKQLLARATSMNDWPTAARIAADLAKLQDQYRITRAARERAPTRQSNLERLRARPPAPLPAKPRLKAVN